MTLNEAAVFEVCHSRAWDAKIITEVYWVNADQVSKTPPTGLYISTGSFIIRGKRNFITPNKLALGFTLMFYLSPESIANHIGERRPRADKLVEDDGSSSSRLAQLKDYDNMPEDPSLSRQSSLSDEPYRVV